MGELRAIEGKLAAMLRRDLAVPDTFPVFVPYATYTKGGRTVSIRLIEGYAFAASGLPETQYFSLEKRSLVTRVFSVSGPGGMRVLQTIANTKILEMRKQLQDILCSDIEIGSTVKITGGNYAHIEGQVVDVYEEKVAVRVDLRSVNIITTVPRSFVEVEGSYNPFVAEIDPATAVEEVSIDDIGAFPWT